MTDRRPIRRNSERGLTLVELIVTVAILSILASAAIPIARFKVKRDKERELRRDLWEMRDAIDHYKDAADKGASRPRSTARTIRPILRRWSMESIYRAKRSSFCAAFLSIR